ncbi:MAG: hypothetical protein PHW65_00085 [Dehalococcoidales bacterium]|nr:hypothetical protein [Dehalococcoidales bacterium]
MDGIEGNDILPGEVATSSEGAVETYDVPLQKESSSVVDLMPNYAEDEGILKATTTHIKTLWPAISSRTSLETIWDNNDKMYRCQPLSDTKENHRANEGSGVMHIAVNQLVSIAYKTLTDNPERYTFGYLGAIDDAVLNDMRVKNAEILTLLLRKAMSDANFKRNLKACLYDLYKNGIAFAVISWEKRMVNLPFRDKQTGELRENDTIQNNLPELKHFPLDQIWLDENISAIDEQPLVGIRSPITLGQIISDVEKGKIKHIDTEDNMTLGATLAKYKDLQAGTQYTVPKSDRMENADRTYQTRTTQSFKHWIMYAKLPIDKDAKKWDENIEEKLYKIRILGDPDSCEIVEIRESILPKGIPVLVAHQTQDDVGMYPVSLGEKVKTYYDQICTAINQLIDNRSKNLRRPVVYDPSRVSLQNYDFGHSNGIPCDGDPRTAFYELQIADMTGTIMNTVNYCENKVREITNTTQAVMGVAMGGRTSANEYLGAKVAATTPIFSDLASIEDALIGEYMRRFAAYIHAFTCHDDLVSILGKTGAEFQYEASDNYKLQLDGVSEAMTHIEKTQALLQLFGMTQDEAARARIKLRLARINGIENPSELISIPAKDQAIKAALWENNEMLVYGRWDDPQPGEMHDVHLQLHRQAEWQAARENNPNVNFIRAHIQGTEMLKRSEQAQVSGASLPAINGQPANPLPTLAEETGEQIAAEIGRESASAASPEPPEISEPVG